MWRMLVGWVIVTLAILLAAYIIPGVRVRNVTTALVAAAVLSLLNALVRPILVFLTFPITILTLGLFLLVVNALMFMLVSAIVPGFEVKNFWSALLGSLVVSVVSLVTHQVF